MFGPISEKSKVICLYFTQFESNVANLDGKGYRIETREEICPLYRGISVDSFSGNLQEFVILKFPGPITIVSGKTRRITFVEVKNDVNHMIDIAKVADLVSLCNFDRLSFNSH